MAEGEDNQDILGIPVIRMRDVKKSADPIVVYRPHFAASYHTAPFWPWWQEGRDTEQTRRYYVVDGQERAAELAGLLGQLV